MKLKAALLEKEQAKLPTASEETEITQDVESNQVDDGKY